MRRLVLGAALLLASTALAEPPSRSLLPMPRPAALTAGQAAPAEAAETPARTDDTPHPMPRPTNLSLAVPLPVPEPPADPAAALPRPMPRPDGLALAPEVVAAPMPEEPAKGRKKKAKASLKGSICADPAIKGEVLASIPAKIKGCGIEEPVRVTSIDGIRLNQPATINCQTASALKTWIERAMKPAFGKREVVELRIAASYACRPRNNVKGNKVSEHGRGNAVDVAGFVFSDGKEWSVAGNYNKEIRKAHKAACGIFGTTLGPGSDGFHEDHLHFDTAGYRSGPYCR